MKKMATAPLFAAGVFLACSFAVSAAQTEGWMGFFDEFTAAYDARPALKKAVITETANELALCRDLQISEACPEAQAKKKLAVDSLKDNDNTFAKLRSMYPDTVNRLFAKASKSCQAWRPFFEEFFSAYDNQLTLTAAQEKALHIQRICKDLPLDDRYCKDKDKIVDDLKKDQLDLGKRFSSLTALYPSLKKDCPTP